jgi:hypothetical protein
MLINYPGLQAGVERGIVNQGFSPKKKFGFGLCRCCFGLKPGQGAFFTPGLKA